MKESLFYFSWRKGIGLISRFKMYGGFCFYALLNGDDVRLRYMMHSREGLMVLYSSGRKPDRFLRVLGRMLLC